MKNKHQSMYYFIAFFTALSLLFSFGKLTQLHYAEVEQFNGEPIISQNTTQLYKGVVSLFTQTYDEARTDYFRAQNSIEITFLDDINDINSKLSDVNFYTMVLHQGKEGLTSLMIQYFVSVILILSIQIMLGVVLIKCLKLIKTNIPQPEIKSLIKWVFILSVFLSVIIVKPIDNYEFSSVKETGIGLLLVIFLTGISTITLSLHQLLKKRKTDQVERRDLLIKGIKVVIPVILLVMMSSPVIQIGGVDDGGNTHFSTIDLDQFTELIHMYDGEYRNSMELALPTTQFHTGLAGIIAYDAKLQTVVNVYALELFDGSGITSSQTEIYKYALAYTTVSISLIYIGAVALLGGTALTLETKKVQQRTLIVLIIGILLLSTTTFGYMKLHEFYNTIPSVDVRLSMIFPIQIALVLMLFLIDHLVPKRLSKSFTLTNDQIISMVTLKKFQKEETTIVNVEESE